MHRILGGGPVKLLSKCKCVLSLARTNLYSDCIPNWEESADTRSARPKCWTRSVSLPLVLAETQEECQVVSFVAATISPAPLAGTSRATVATALVTAVLVVSRAFALPVIYAVSLVFENIVVQKCSPLLWSQSAYLINSFGRHVVFSCDHENQRRYEEYDPHRASDFLADDAEVGNFLLQEQKRRDIQLLGKITF